VPYLLAGKANTSEMRREKSASLCQTAAFCYWYVHFYCMALYCYTRHVM